MKNLLLTINFNNQNYAKFTIPFMKKYCEKYNIDFLIISENNIDFKNLYNKVKCGTGNFFPCVFAKLLIKDLLSKYDQILYCDLDVIVSPFALNIFKEIKYNQIGAVLDVGYNNSIQMEYDIQKIDKILDLNIFEQYIKNNKYYFNAGVFIITKENKKIFNIIDKIIQTNIDLYFAEQSMINYAIYYYNLNLKFLNDKWNCHGCCKDKKIKLTEKYFIHFTQENKKKQIKNFLKYNIKQL